MLFMVLLQNYVVLHTRSALKTLHDIDDGPDGRISISFADQNDGQDGLYFALDAEAVVDPINPENFTVKDLDGDAIEFTAYLPARLPHDIPDSMTIRKATVTFTYMYDSKVNSDEEVSEMSLGDILSECATGHMLGMTTGSTVEGVQNFLVAAEEVALDCDGTFFADPDAQWDAENGQGPTATHP